MQQLIALLVGFLLSGCQLSDTQELESALDRYAELSTRSASAAWPVEFGEILVSDALTAAEAGYLLLADAGISQLGQITFDQTRVLSPGTATTCLNLTASQLQQADGSLLPEKPNVLIKVSFQRLAGILKISSFDLEGAPC